MGLKKFPFYKQFDQIDCGPTCLKMIAKHHGKSYTTEFLQTQSQLTKEGVSFSGLAEAAESIGFHSLGVYTDLATLQKEVPLPCIAHWRQQHFVVVYAVKKNKIHVADPAYGLVEYDIKDFMLGWMGRETNDSSEKGYLLLLEPTPKFYSDDGDAERTFGFKYLFRYFTPFKSHILQLAFGLLAGSLLQLIFPFLTQAVVDYGINYQNINFVYLILIAQIVLFISQTSVEVIRGWILLHVTSRVNINLISDFLIKLMRLPIAFFDSRNTGDIIQRIYDHNRIESFLSTTTLDTLFSIVNVLVFGVILAYYDIYIFLVFFFGSTLYIAWTLIFMKKRAELDYRRFDQSSENQSSLYQLISGMQEIKLNGSERRRRWEWEGIQVQLFKISIKGLSLSQVQNTGGRFLNEMKNILITFISAKAVIDGGLTLGMMLSVQYIIGQLNLPINNFISFLQTGQDAKLSLERLSEIHTKKEEEDMSDESLSELPEEHSIKFNKVSFSYAGTNGSKVLDNLSFEIPQGKVTAIVGASGSGKTTLIKLLLKFYEPTEGTIGVGNVGLEDLKTSFWRKQCGTVMQDGFLFGDTIARNITESDSESAVDKKRLANATKLANLSSFVSNSSSGYHTKVGASGVNISGGQHQRILIARAVYKNPKYLFFDEATSALDANNEKAIMKNLDEFYKGRTVVVVAHRLSTVKNADQILVLDKGRIIERGTHDELARRKEAYYTLVKNQLELGT